MPMIFSHWTWQAFSAHQSCVWIITEKASGHAPPCTVTGRGTSVISPDNGASFSRFVAGDREKQVTLLPELEVLVLDLPSGHHLTYEVTQSGDSDKRPSAPPMPSHPLWLNPANGRLFPPFQLFNFLGGGRGKEWLGFECSWYYHFAELLGVPQNHDISFMTSDWTICVSGIMDKCECPSKTPHKDQPHPQGQRWLSNVCTLQQGRPLHPQHKNLLFRSSRGKWQLCWNNG